MCARPRADDARGPLADDLVDLEGDVLVRRDAEELAALGRHEDEALAVEGVVDRGQVHLTDEVVGEAAAELVLPEEPQHSSG